MSTATATAKYDMPNTQTGAPPSFYNQAASMQTGGGAAQPGQPASTQPDPDSLKFKQMTAKLLTVLDAMHSMKPNGVDVSKNIQAAADAVKSAIVLADGGDTGTTPGTNPAAGDTGQISGDTTGSSAGAAAGAVQ